MYIARHREAKAYYNPVKVAQNKLDYETPKFYTNIAALIVGIKRLKNYRKLDDWDFYEVSCKLEKFEVCDIF